jgi:fructokinase
MGHIRIPHDLARDPFRGCCPYHGDCLEGLACGPAIQARWGVAAATALPPDHPGWALEAHYLALAVNNWACVLSPQRIVMGGGVMQQEQLFPAIREELGRLANGYARFGDIVPPALGSRAGILGALTLAAQSVRL